MFRRVEGVEIMLLWAESGTKGHVDWSLPQLIC